MTQPMHIAAGVGATPLLAQLLGEVVTARESERAEQRRHGVTTDALTLARLGTLGALEDYAAALHSLSWPVPRTLQQEIRLHRALCGLTG
jgi:hypothetical protein